MRNSLRLSSAAITLLATAAAAPAVAQTMVETLSNAYTQSTQLGGARAQQRATDEQVPQALSNWRPTITVTGGITRTHTSTDPQPYDQSFFSPPQNKNIFVNDGYNTEKTVGVQVVQNIYRGGRTDAQVNQ